MALGAPRATKAGIAKPGPNAWGGRFMGGGSQGKTRDAQYAQAVPPSLNAGTMLVLEQRAYFSAWRTVFAVPSVTSSNLVLPCGPAAGGAVPDINPLGA